MLLNIPVQYINAQGAMRDSTQKGTQEDLKEDRIRLDPHVAKDNLLERALTTHDSLIYPNKYARFYHPAGNRYAFYQSLGDAGMPILPRLVNWERNRGFQTGWTMFDSYFYTQENEQYYRSYMPFTRMTYTQTKTEYVHLKGFHTQNISPGWNAALRFQTINNKGFYPRQRNSLRQLGLSSRYTSKNNRYYIQGGFNWNRVNLEENGGWLDETLFDSLSGTNKSGEVILDNTLTVFSQNEHHIQQIYWFTGKSLPYDDTLDIYKPLFGIKHSSKLKKTKHFFNSSGFDLLFLPDNLYDSIETRDSVVFRNHTHQIGITTYQTDSTFFGLYGGVGVEIISGLFERHQKVNPANNFFIDGNVFLNPTSEIRLSSDNYLYLSGYNAGDFQLQGQIHWLPEFIRKRFNPDEGLTHGQKPGLEFEMKVQQSAPGYIFNHFISNHFEWENNFSKEQLRKIRAGLHLPFKANELRLQVIFQNIKNPLYWNEQMTPNQAAGNYSQVHTTLSWNLRLYRFHLNNQLIWQLPDEKTNNLFRTPEWSGLHSVYYQNSMFNNVLKLQLGADLQWFSEYYANAYNPVTRTFYIQNRRKQGNYPLTDLFVAAEIHTFRAFVKLEHANFEFREDKFPNLYYSTPGYSLPPRRLLFGIIWKFYI